MKKLILTANLILIAVAMFSTSSFAATKTPIKYRTLNAHTFTTKTKLKKKAVAQRPMKAGQKTIICGKSAPTITSAIANIQSDLNQSSVKSHTAKNLTVHQPFSPISSPIVHSEKRKRTADVYVACVKIRKA